MIRYDPVRSDTIRRPAPPDPRQVCTSLITVFGKLRDWQRAQQVQRWAQAQGVPLDCYFFCALMTALTQSGRALEPIPSPPILYDHIRCDPIPSHPILSDPIRSDTI